jgi:hypothetical protein
MKDGRNDFHSVPPDEPKKTGRNLDEDYLKTTPKSMQYFMREEGIAGVLLCR